MTFENKEQLLNRLRIDIACEEGMEYVKSQPDLQTILENCPQDYCVWCLRKGYEQFAEHCDWARLIEKAGSGCCESSHSSQNFKNNPLTPVELLLKSKHQPTTSGVTNDFKLKPKQR